MTRKEFGERIAEIDPESAEAVDELAALFEEDYRSAGKDLNDPAVIQEIHTAVQADLEHFMRKYDDLLEKINDELRKAGATLGTFRQCRTACDFLFSQQQHGKKADPHQLSDHILSG